MPEVVCPEIEDERVGSARRTSDRPCAGWCGPGDFDAWRYKAQQRTEQALLRKDLDPSTRATLEGWREKIVALNRPLVDAREEVRMLAAMAKQAECIALAPTQSNLPSIINPEPPKWYQRSEILVGLGLLAVIYWLHSSGQLRKLEKRIFG